MGRGGRTSFTDSRGLNTADEGKVGAGRRSSCAAMEAEAKKVTKQIVIYVFERLSDNSVKTTTNNQKYS